MKYTIVIADDHLIIREALAQILQADSRFELVGQASNGIEAIAMLKRLTPDLLFLDVSMPYAGAIEVYVELKRWSPATKTIIFTGVNSGEGLKSLYREGVDSILFKSDDTTTILTAIEKVLIGERYLSENIQLYLDTGSELDALTSREVQILQLVVVGSSNQDIAKLLSISEKTVDNHRTNLMKKLNVHSLSELLKYATKVGLTKGSQ